MRRLYCCTAAFLLFAGHAGAGKEALQLKYEPLVPGVDYAVYKTEIPPVYVHIVRIDLSQRGIRIAALKAKGRESVDQMAARYTADGRKPIAVINGDYFEFQAAGRPWGMHVHDEEVVFTPSKKNSAFMIGVDGKPVIDIPRVQLVAQFGSNSTWHEILSVNRQEFFSKQGLHLFSVLGELSSLTLGKGYGITLKGGPTALGKVVKFTVAKVDVPSSTVTIPLDGYVLNYNPKAHTGTTQIKQKTEVRIKGLMIPAATEAIGGGPRLLRSGKPSIEFGKEDFSPSHEAYLKSRPDPRSAVGYTHDRRFVFFVVVEGRISRSKGMELNELADFMESLGVSDAMGFDGGGSATMFTEKYRSQTAEGSMRQVANGLGVFQLTGKAK